MMRTSIDISDSQLGRNIQNSLEYVRSANNTQPKKFDKNIFRNILKLSPEQTSNPQFEKSDLQNIFHGYLKDSITLDCHDLLNLYLNFKLLEPKFEPSVKTINLLIHYIRFNKIKSSIKEYAFFLDIEPSFGNDELEQALELLRLVYDARMEDEEKEREFDRWIDQLIES